MVCSLSRSQSKIYRPRWIDMVWGSYRNCPLIAIALWVRKEVARLSAEMEEEVMEKKTEKVLIVQEIEE